MFVNFSKIFGGENCELNFCLCVRLLKKRVPIKIISVILVFVRMLIRYYVPSKYVGMIGFSVELRAVDEEESELKGSFSDFSLRSDSGT